MARAENRRKIDHCGVVAFFAVGFGPVEPTVADAAALLAHDAVHVF